MNVNKKIQFTKDYIKNIIKLAKQDLKAKANEDYTNSVTYYNSEVKSFDIPTLKFMASNFKDPLYRLEVGVLFCNNENIDTDYIMVELYERLEE